MDIGYLPLAIGIITIIANIGIAIYNVGKNRVIYNVEEIVTESRDLNKDRTVDKILTPKLSKGEYTILNCFQDVSNTQKKIYVLGKIQKQMNKPMKKIIAREGIVVIVSVAVGATLTLFFARLNIPIYFLPPDLNSDIVAVIIIICPYILFSLARFIIWAIRTLREK